jgi:CheY-like chemotaxis protein
VVLGEPEEIMTATKTNSETILVVEDEQVVLDLITNILQDAGYRVLRAVNGDEAIRIGSQHNADIDLVLTDIVMPGMSGGELVQQLLPLKPGMHVLYMSGYTKYTMVGQGVLESVNSFIWKPFSPATLLHKVREVLDGSAGTD